MLKMCLKEGQFLYVGECCCLQFAHVWCVAVHVALWCVPPHCLQVKCVCVHCDVMCPNLKHLLHCFIVGIGVGSLVLCLLYVKSVIVGLKRCASDVLMVILTV